MAAADDTERGSCRQTNVQPDQGGYKHIGFISFLGRFRHRGGTTYRLRAENSLKRKTVKINTIKKMEEKKYKCSPKSGRTTKIISFAIDNDLVPYVQSLANKSRFINGLLRNYFEKNLVERK